MLNIMLEDLIAPPLVNEYIESPTSLQAGDKVRLVSGVEGLLVDYQKEYPEENEYWLAMAKIVSSPYQNYFSVLHVADERSAYPIGTVIIEIAPNEDIEVHSSILEKI